ncbi:hypothetical protein MGAST_01055 [Mycobacterium gastri 'Wayne']|nr:hypothetical protein MGAST_01055 [Mycobacterium gastri 'Wayne']
MAGKIGVIPLVCHRYVARPFEAALTVPSLR